MSWKPHPRTTEAITLMQLLPGYMQMNYVKSLMYRTLSANRDSIPSPQCALGTTPHLSIRETATRRKKTNRRRRRREEEGKCPGEDSRGHEGRGERNREITKHVYDTQIENMSQQLIDNTSRGSRTFKRAKGSALTLWSSKHRPVEEEQTAES